MQRNISGKIKVVKQRIIEEASDLFLQAGVKSTTMDDLARHMGISKRTIYENFKDKETLLIACIDAFRDENHLFFEKVFTKAENVVNAILVLLQKGAEQAAQRQFNMINDIRKYYPLVFKEHLTSLNDNKCKEMGLLIQRGINEGVFREDLNPEIIAYFFCRRPEDHDSWLDKFSIIDVFENLVITFLRGICTSKGLEIIEKYKNNKPPILLK